MSSPDLAAAQVASSEPPSPPTLSRTSLRDFDVEEAAGLPPPPPPPPLAPPAAGGGTPLGFERFKRHLEALLSMGFTRAVAQEALFRTQNGTVEAAVDWILTQDPLDLAQLDADAALGALAPPPRAPALARHASDPAGGAAPLADDDAAPPPMRRLVRQTHSHTGISGAAAAALHLPRQRREQRRGREAGPGGTPAQHLLRLQAQREAAAGAGGGAALRPSHGSAPGEAQVTCNICFEEVAAGEAVRFPRCGDAFCRSCVAGYLIANINDGKVLELRCPMYGVAPECVCERIYEGEVEAMLGRVRREAREQLGSAGEGKGDEGEDGEVPLLAKYKRFVRNRLAERDPSALWCPTAGCDTVCRPSGLYQRYWSKKVTCGTCGEDMCRKCGRAYHGNWVRCGAVTDAALAEYSRQKLLQPCPSCKRLTEKLDACPHMTCVCGHQWCWVCREPYPCSNFHFGRSGYGRGEDIGELWSVWRCSIVMRILLLFCAIYLLPPVALLCAALFLSVCPCFSVAVFLKHCTSVDLDHDLDVLPCCSCNPDDCADGYRDGLLGLAACAGALVAGVAAGALLLAVCLLGALGLPAFLLAALYDACALARGGLGPSRSVFVAPFEEEAFEGAYEGPIDADDAFGLLCFARLMLAWFWVAITVLPTLAASLLLLPVAPLLLCPTIIDPLGTERLPIALRLFLSAAVGAAAYLLVEAATGATFALPDGLGLSALYSSVALGAAAAVAAAATLAYPPVSNCAFMAPLWMGCVSPAILIAATEEDARNMAFGPTPSPLMFFD